MSNQLSEKLRKEGNDLFYIGDFKGALSKYLESSHLGKENPVIYSNLAATYIKLEKWEDVITSCDQGLSILNSTKEDNKSLHVKLLWRKSIALRKQYKYIDALLFIDKALSIDPKNKILLDEKFTINSFLNNDNSSNIVSIPIEEVDEIPKSFYKPKIKSTNSIIPPITDKNNDSNQLLINLDKNYPDNPSVQFLTTLKFKPKSTLPKYYHYILTIEPKKYENIFKLTGVDPEFLDFFLTACQNVLQCDQLQFKSKIINLLLLFKSLPRFSLTATFADPKKVQNLTLLFESKLNENFANFWL